MKQLSHSKLLTNITSATVIDQAYAWLCKQRKDYPHNADIWHFRYYWHANRQSLISQIKSGRYLFSPQQRITLANGNVIHLWSAQDALVMKTIAIVLTPSLAISPRCTHTKGHGGLKGALRWLHRKLPFYRFVFRSDVKGYYESIDHNILISQLEKQVPAHDVMALLIQVIRRTVEWGGTFKTIRRGIGRSSPLSPLFAAVYLKPLDDAMDKAGLAYVRYMDDWVVLTQTRWQMRRVVALVNRTLAEKKLDKHPDKTWVGKIERGFDFLGYHHTPAGLTPAKATLARFYTQLTRLQEQGAHPERIGVYKTRWWRWVRAGLPMNLVLDIPDIYEAWLSGHGIKSSERITLPIM